MIKIRNVHISRGGSPILKNISLTIRPGEVVAVVGANGAGKSTLLQAIAGALLPTQGLISLNGKALADWPATQLARVRGILSQKIALSFAFPVIEVVKLGRHPYSQLLSTQENEAIAWHCLQQVGMEEFAYRNMHTLSGGEQQRVHFARVLAQIYQPHSEETSYILLDEPTSSLDLYQQHQLLQMAKNLSTQRRVGIFVILHDLNLAAQYADHVLLLKKGKTISQGPPEEVFTQAHIYQGFNVRTEVMKPPTHDQVFIKILAKPGLNTPNNAITINPH